MTFFSSYLGHFKILVLVITSINPESANDIYKKRLFSTTAMCKCVHMLLDFWNKKKDVAQSTSIVLQS